MEIFYILIPTGDYLRYECNSVPDYSAREWQHRRVLGYYYPEKKEFEVTVEDSEEAIDVIANVAWWYCDREIVIRSKFGACTLGDVVDAADKD